MNNPLRIIKHRIVLFTASRYVGYLLQFVRGILIAKYLGPVPYGIWGFLMLVQQYLTYSGLGLHYAVNAELAITPPALQKRSELIGSALFITGLISSVLIIVGLGVQVTRYPIFDKYQFNQYALTLCIIVGLHHLQQLFANIYRVLGNLKRIAITELLSAIITLISVLLFKNSPALINLLLWAFVISGFLSVLVYLVKAPFKIIFRISRQNLLRLLTMGIPLLIYNISHHLITASGRTIVSSFYSLEEMGYYSFSNNITHGVMLGLNAVSWVLFPNILSKTHSDIPNKEVAVVVQKVNYLYNTSVLVVIYLVILFLPLLFKFLPQYKQASISLSILLLAQGVLSASFGFNCVAIARKKQMKVAGISAISASMVAGLSSLLASVGVSFDWISLAVLLGAFVYSTFQSMLGARLIEQPASGFDAFRSIIPWGSLFAVVILLIGLLFGHPIIAGLIGFLLLILTNKQKIKLILQFVIEKSSQQGKT